MVLKLFGGGSNSAKVFAISISKGRARRESIARKAIANIPEFEALSWDWKKENYSMGHGTFLQSSIVGNLGEEAKTYSGRVAPPYWYEIEFDLCASAPASKWFRA
ncbi:hypothetical protein LCGC14_2558300 [marine sediment metagenome]|uniref:Uncharacterized protein n=1 Tax=marine sediment metagenome TaxID=412755 RepID=A0A0F9CX43_9ZZZZ